MSKPAAEPRIVFLVPRRRDQGPRDAIWEYCRARWEALFPDVAVVEGHHDEGLFNRAAAVNRAAAKAGAWDLAIVIDSDVVLSRSQVQAAIDTARRTGKVTWAHRRWRGIREDMTTRIVADGRDLGTELDRDEIDLLVERTNPISWSCCFVVPRAVWDDIGGMDERFEGWGFEDLAWQSVVCGLYGHERIEGDVVHLWHPRSEERIVPGQPRLTATPEYVTNARLGRRYMVALRRDHGLHDRPGLPATEEERERDIANLKRDDAAYAQAVRRHRLPDWDQWWPTLEELRDGAKAHRGGPDPSVTLIVHTGGEPQTWPDRSRYLRRSLESLVANVTGPIVQRRIYSDWGEAFVEELRAIAQPHGFLVVGPDAHKGYGPSMALEWAWIVNHAKGTYVFRAEDDFLYDRPVDLGPMIATLLENPQMRQLALLRASAYPREFAEGGVIASLKTPVELRNHRPHPFLEHRDHFTANPSLIRKDLALTPWPQGESSERRFGDSLLLDSTATFGYWGSGEPWIHHIGEKRAAAAY